MQISLFPPKKGSKTFLVGSLFEKPLSSSPALQTHYQWHIRQVLPHANKWMSHFPGAQVILGLQAVEPQAKKWKSPVSCDGLGHTSMAQHRAMRRVCVHLPTSAWSLHGQCACCPPYALQPLHGCPCPALTILSDQNHPFQTGSLVANLWLILLTWFGLHLMWKSHLLGAL